MRARRAFFWGLLTLFVGLSIWWLFYLPYDREALYSAVPLNAVFVGEHEKVAERWQAIVENPLTLCLLKSCGMDAKDVEKSVHTPGVRRIIQRYAARDTIIAYAPSLGRSGQPAWMVSSWAGSQGQILRLALTCGGLSGFKKLSFEDGQQAWYTTIGKGKSEMNLSLVVVQGILLVCLSPDPSAVHYMADRVERRASLLPELRERLASASEGSESKDVLDRGWLDGAWLVGRPVVGKVRYGLNAHAECGSAGWVRGTMRLPAAPLLRDSVDFDGLGDLLGNAPDALLMIPFSYLDPLISTNKAGPAWKIAGPFFKEEAADRGSVFAALFGGDYSGRILGLKVPTVMAGMEARNPDGILDRLSETTDRLNRECRWGLVPTRTEIQKRPAAVLGLSRDNLFASLKPEERPVFVAVTNWLLLCSNAETTEKLLARNRDSSEARWMAGIEKAKAATGYMWIDLEASNQALKNAVAVYTLSLLVQSSEGRIESRAQLNNLSGWIDALRSLKSCRLWLKSSESEFDLQFEFGPAR
jgi:hypothetical protein